MTGVEATGTSLEEGANGSVVDVVAEGVVEGLWTA